MTGSLPVILLVGGFGSRMGADMGDLPKPLVEVGGRPILWHVMKLYAHYGHTDFIFPLGYKGEMFRRYFLEYEALAHDVRFKLGEPDRREYTARGDERDWRVMLSDAGLATNKGSRIRLAAEFLERRTSLQTQQDLTAQNAESAHGQRQESMDSAFSAVRKRADLKPSLARRLDNQEFLVTYGDGIGDVNIHALLAFHHSHHKLATVTGYQPFSQYGIVDVAKDGQVRQLVEKPRLRQWINAGFFVFQRGVLDYLAGDQVDLEKEALPKLATDGELMMYKHTGFWASMDTFKDAQYLNDVWEADEPWKVWE